MFALASALAGCGGESPQPSALELLQAGERPYETWKLQPASTDEISAALSDCVKAAEADLGPDAAVEHLEQQGWMTREYPSEMTAFLRSADDEYRQKRSQASQEASSGSRLTDTQDWPIVLEHRDQAALLAIEGLSEGSVCSVLTDPADDGYETISRAVAQIDGGFAAHRTETPHGFYWDSGEVRIYEDYGDGFGGRWDFFPPVFSTVETDLDPTEGVPTAHLSAINCRGNC